MKIVDVCGFYSEAGGGVKSYVRQKFEAARRHGHELIVIAQGAETRREPVDGGQIAWVASCMRLIMLMPYMAIGITTNELMMCAKAMGMPNNMWSATDMMLASIENSRNVKEA